jgi:prolyl 4-hydroxylase
MINIKNIKNNKTLLILLFIFIVILILYIYNKYTKKPRYIDMPDYTVQEIDDFLTHEECDYIIKLTDGNLVPSKVYNSNDDMINNISRTSKQTWFKDVKDPLIKKLSDKVAYITNIPNTEKNFYEDLQVVNYPNGGFFVPHYDPCDGDKKFCARMNGINGPRLFTFLIYLNDDFEGGETEFPLINKKVIPKKGKAVLFYSVGNDGRIIKQSLHAGKPVISGTKWIANKWVRINI